MYRSGTNATRHPFLICFFFFILLFILVLKSECHPVIIHKMCPVYLANRFNWHDRCAFIFGSPLQNDSHSDESIPTEFDTLNTYFGIHIIACEAHRANYANVSIMNEFEKKIEFYLPFMPTWFLHSILDMLWAAFVRLPW